MRTLLQGQGHQDSLLRDLFQPWWSRWGCSGWGSFRCKGRVLLRQSADLVRRIWWYFTKPKGEKFSGASEELESGTAKSCLWLFSSPSQHLLSSASLIYADTIGYLSNSSSSAPSVLPVEIASHCRDQKHQSIPLPLLQPGHGPVSQSRSMDERVHLLKAFLRKQSK